jgi:hypothetical protein
LEEGNKVALRDKPKGTRVKKNPTKGKKKELIPFQTSFGWVFKFEGGGEVPAELQGTFSYEEIMKKLMVYKNR